MRQSRFGRVARQGALPPSSEETVILAMPKPQCLGGSTHGRLGESFDEGKGGVGDFAPAAVNGEGMSTVLDLDDLGDALVVLLLLVGGVAIAGGTVWSSSPEMIDNGPRCGLSVSTFAAR